jgi:hypothetical protein
MRQGARLHLAGLGDFDLQASLLVFLFSSDYCLVQITVVVVTVMLANSYPRSSSGFQGVKNLKKKSDLHAPLRQGARLHLAGVGDFDLQASLVWACSPVQFQLL